MLDIDQMKIALCFLLRQPTVKAPRYWEKWLEMEKGDQFLLLYHCDSTNAPPRHFLKRAKRVANAGTCTSWGNFGVVQAESQLYKEAFEDLEVTHALLLTDWCIPIYEPKHILHTLCSARRSWIQWSCFSPGGPKAELQKAVTRDFASRWINACKEPPSKEEEANRKLVHEQASRGRRAMHAYQNHDEVLAIRRLWCQWATLESVIECRPLTLSAFRTDFDHRAMQLNLLNYDTGLLELYGVLFVRKVKDAHIPESMPFSAPRLP